MLASIFDTSIEYLKGVGPQRASLLQKELQIFTYGDLIQHYPFRYEDRTRFYTIKELREDMSHVQIKGRITSLGLAGTGFKKRLVAKFQDETGSLQLVWFQGISWVAKKITTHTPYVIFGKPNRYGSVFSIAHPEIVPEALAAAESVPVQPIYNLTEKLKVRYMDNRFFIQAQKEVLHQTLSHVNETLPENILKTYRFLDKVSALAWIHFPSDARQADEARRRLKFEELFFIQLYLLKLKLTRIEKNKGAICRQTGLMRRFYEQHLPFTLTNAQKRVIKEIYADLKSGKQMNRLLQGDVGSGKTMVAFICMLIAVGSGLQAALMAPTEILAQQHYATLRRYAEPLNITVGLLTGSTKKRDRKIILQDLAEGRTHILIGTHALLEDAAKFHSLGLAVIDEQHKFGVAQRSQLWKKNENISPHILVMTATPIPRTLAMTLYGELDVSVIDAMPKGRKPIKTMHRFENARLQINQFIRDRIQEGRQVYIVYPLIEESEKLDLKHLMEGYENMCRAFPDIPVSIVHGKMEPRNKEFEMARFVKGETKIMIATTVIEVGVDVPNATLIVIESAERFGLSQLHQLRGRVGRGSEQSYCILVTDVKLSTESRTRMKALCQTNDGFVIAETDLKLRGPGDLMGTQQSGLPELAIADLSTDGSILQEARKVAQDILTCDPDLQQQAHAPIKRQINAVRKSVNNWSRIS